MTCDACRLPDASSARTVRPTPKHCLDRGAGANAGSMLRIRRQCLHPQTHRAGSSAEDDRTPYGFDLDLQSIQWTIVRYRCIGRATSNLKCNTLRPPHRDRALLRDRQRGRVRPGRLIRPPSWPRQRWRRARCARCGSRRPGRPIQLWGVGPTCAGAGAMSVFTPAARPSTYRVAVRPDSVTARCTQRPVGGAEVPSTLCSPWKPSTVMAKRSASAPAPAPSMVSRCT